VRGQRQFGVTEMRVALRRALDPLCVVLLIGAGLGASATSGQSQPQNPEQQRPVFRTGVDFVRVDVYPRRNNKVVEGLVRDDFQVFEDGVRQIVETFEYIPIDLDRGAEPLDPRTRSEAQRMAADPRNRVFVFYLDVYEITMEGAYRAREPLLEFVQKSMGPRDLFAWMTPKDSPEFIEFTRMSQELASVMSVASSWGKKETPVTDPEEMKLQACMPPPPNAAQGAPNALVVAKRNMEVMDDVRELIVRLGALRQERKNLVILGERWINMMYLPVRGPAASTPGTPSLQVGFPPRGRGSFEPQISETANFCAAARAYLFGYDARGRLESLTELARRNNVALYFVSLAPKSLFNFSLARTFAEETDGRAMVTNDIALNLQQVLDHQTGFYMLGYRSTGGESGTKPRNVRVRTTKPGVDLDVRRVYEPPPPEFVAARNAPRTPPAPRTEIEQAIDRLPIVRDDVDVHLHWAPRPDRAEVTVELTARISGIEPWRSGGQVSASFRNEEGVVVASGDAAIVTGERSVRLALPGASPVRGRVFVRLSHTSGATISETIAVGAFPIGAIGQPVFLRAGSLPRLPFQPAADLSFGRTERLRVEWPLAPGVSAPVVRLLNSAGAALNADVTITAESDVLRADLRLLTLAPGTYVLEAAGTAESGPVRVLTAIRITR
jgi:VWFA-related protein